MRSLKTLISAVVMTNLAMPELAVRVVLVATHLAALMVRIFILTLVATLATWATSLVNSLAVGHARLVVDVARGVMSKRPLL